MSTENPKENAKKQKQLNRIIKLKQSSHVTVIQSRWRGHLARLVGMKPKVAQIVPAPDTPGKKFRRSGTTYQLARASFMETYTTVTLQRVQMSKVTVAEFYVDGAAGLPYSGTVTRVTARMMAENKSQIGEMAKPTFSHPDTDYTSPGFDLNVHWRGNILIPSITIICRVDTLESPSMEAKTVGYAALKLCVDANNQQPSAVGGSCSPAECFLNAGHYLLPIYYGRVPEGPLNQALIESMTPIEGAYLNVRLFDAVAEEKFSHNFKDHTPQSANSLPLPAKEIKCGQFSVNYDYKLSRRSVAQLVAGTVSRLVPCDMKAKFPLSKKLLEDMHQNKTIEKDQRVQLTKRLQDWFVTAFPPIDSMRATVDPRFLLRYEHAEGAMVALDMLYNMPERKKLIKAAASATTVKAIENGLLRGGWDSKLNLFKTVFRYLPGAPAVREVVRHDPRDKSTAGGSAIKLLGSAPKLMSVRNVSIRNLALSTETDSAENIIDDASVALHLDSHETCPYYTDDYSCTAGMKLHSAACILVIVTAVDVLTSSVGRVEIEKEKTDPRKASAPVPEALRRNMTRTGSMLETPEMREKKLEKAKKLEGLIGIYPGHNDRKANWWGLLPVHTPSPCAVTPPAASENDGAIPAVTPHSTNSNTSGFESVQQVTTPLLERLPFGATFEKPAGPRPAPVNNEPACFVNAGTHQIPLFEGLPPDELITADDPMQWLVDKLRAQSTFERRLALQDSFLHRFFCIPMCSTSGSAVLEPGDNTERNSSASLNGGPSNKSTGTRSNSNSRRRSSRKFNDATLTLGSSVMVRLVDSRLRQLDGPPMVRDIAKPVSEKALKTVLKAASSYLVETEGGHRTHAQDKAKYNALCKRFNFIALRDVETRTVRSAIPDNVHAETLLEEVNVKFSQTMFD